MHERSAAQAALRQNMFHQYAGHLGNGSSTADQLHKLADLKERGFITDAEFQAEKERILT
jgi:Short C-terminal domain